MDIEDELTLDPMPLLCFSYHKSLAPVMWVFIALASVELLVVHLLLVLWSKAIALTLSLITLVMILWLMRLVLSFKRLPVTLGDGELVLRVGDLRVVRVAIANVAGLRTNWPSGSLKDSTVLNLALISYPNLLVDLHEPIINPRRRERVVRSIAHRFDDPAAFTSAFTQIWRP